MVESDVCWRDCAGISMPSAGPWNTWPIAAFAGGHETDTADLHRAIERLDRIALDLESVQERARLLQEEITGRTAEATNHNLYIVSLLTAIFLPITLITGIFGMNVGGVPWVDRMARTAAIDRDGELTAHSTFSTAPLFQAPFDRRLA